jgi:hypothetical protein
MKKQNKNSQENTDTVQSGLHVELKQRILKDIGKIRAGMEKTTRKEPWFSPEYCQNKDGIPGFKLTVGDETLAEYIGVTGGSMKEKGILAMCENIYYALNMAESICIPPNPDEYKSPQERIEGLRLVGKEVFKKLSDTRDIWEGLLQSLQYAVIESDDKEKDTAAYGLISFRPILSDVLDNTCQLEG